jgi:epoxyqueuosine reductase
MTHSNQNIQKKPDSHFQSKEIEWIQQRSQDEGFLESSIINLMDEPRFPSYIKWLENGYHGPLDYLGKNLDIREDPKKLGKQLQSAIVFLHPYPSEFSSRHIARYAWGKDYHHTIKAKLFSLAEAFQDQFGPLLEHRVCVDTAPLLERSLAERSGLGWIGKNGCLISRKHGSFFLIASWLTSKKSNQEPNPTHPFHCGTCTRCLEACPTDAFVSPGQLDAAKCLSTLTIENRSTIPTQYFKSIQEQAFGCDICQTVCPWNRTSTPQVEHERLPSLEKLLTLSESEFRDHFRKTALERPGWHGLRRNFLILASNSADVPLYVFKDHLQHPNDMVRQTAQDILSQMT